MSIWWLPNDDLQAEAVGVVGGAEPHDGGRLGLALLPRLLHLQVSGFFLLQNTLKIASFS